MTGAADDRVPDSPTATILSLPEDLSSSLPESESCANPVAVPKADRDGLMSKVASVLPVVTVNESPRDTAAALGLAEDELL
jgi:hypothetical protein